MAFHLTFVWNCKQALQNSPVFPRQLPIASVPAGEHQHCHARAASPRSQAQSFAISKNVPFQWRKKGGRWHMAKAMEKEKW